ncbi:DUF1622 domain-containing protein [Accumulibacter sp.]|uniref:DUF1622 domain-containing protein n=1 Tax=Accumulibacter sp. TaxID=2053492 RepID=UPI0025D8DE3B|nr:DUF1622 domain-containing protein [Accumulibacter sp.]MCM8595378.1 DUF1622 domain-containing protein [Accumulibacter sp.]MCM8626441.1 DUF1622 domain-containing protein [Accumulibacter sp.]MDS4049525.1 DUF1622 domain-containing protein [Accumulibacter sp.]
MTSFSEIAEMIGVVLDAVGILVMVGGMLAAVVRCLAFRRDGRDAYRQIRQDIGRAILLALEFLVAADIIRTVAVTPTLEGVVVLGLIVVIRTFLSTALQVELEGQWPWSRSATVGSSTGRSSRGEV